ncbi:MAG TPA: DUF3365 domain-containing protein [Caulifigura sp.]|nr:DUF3365 domain-containing protein [Caulifigura sp.]
MTRMSFWPLVAAVSASALIAVARAADPPKTERPAASKPSPEALERTRREVRMLDDLYKTSIVMITDAYVTEKSDLPAGSAFQKLFQTMREKGWHDVRLIDATGEPYDDDNLPKDDFEKSAIKALKAGQASDEKIVTKNGKNYLRVATAIPVVMEKCTLCHENYKKVPKGQAIGALGYEIEIR